jgi:ERF superfamily
MNEVIEMQEPETRIAVQHTAAVATTTPASLLQIAVQRGASMEELKSLMDLQDRYEANEARKAFVAAMAEFKKNAPTILKDKNVSFTGTSYNHATLGGICEVVIEALAEHGFSHDWDTVQPDSGMIETTCILTHVLGHTKKTTLKAPPDNSGKKNGIQQISSTITYLERYTLLGVCGLATKDLPDDDGRSAGEQKPKAKAKHPLNDAGFNRALEAIKSKEYTVSEIEATYALTDAQLSAARDAEAAQDA